MLCEAFIDLVLNVLNNFPIPGYLIGIKNYNHVILLNLKHVITLPSYVAIINRIFLKLTFKKETTNPYKMKIKYELVLNGMNWVETYQIKNNTICAFKTNDSIKPGYYIVQCTGNVYTLQ